MTSGQTNDRRSDRAASVAVPFAAIVVAMLPAVLDQTILEGSPRPVRLSACNAPNRREDGT